MNGKMETKTEDQIREWVEALTNEEVYDTFDALRSGIILCKLINAIKPGTIPKFNERPNPIMERGLKINYIRLENSLNLLSFFR